MVRLIIFDVDGTFYDLEDVVQSNYELRVDFFAAEKNITRKAAEDIFSREGILRYKSENARSATEFFLNSGIDPEAWTTYCESHFSPAPIDRKKAVPNELVKGFAELATLVLLSSSPLNCIDSTLEWLGIDRSLFADVICSSTYSGEGRFSKRSAIGSILEKYGLPAEAVLSIGDRYESDIRPLLEMGGDGILIERPSSLNAVLQAIRDDTLEAQNGHGYKYYNGRTLRGKLI